MVTLSTIFFVNLPATSFNRAFRFFSTFVQWGPCRKLSAKCSEHENAVEAMFMPFLATLHLCVRIMSKKDANWRACPDKGMIYAWHIMGRNADMEISSTRLSLLGIWPAKIIPIQGKSTGQARHKINWYDVSKTVSSVPGIAGLLIMKKTKHGVIARTSEETKILVQNGQQWILFSCNFRVTNPANLIFLNNRSYFLKPFFPCFCEERRKLLVTLSCCWGMSFSWYRTIWKHLLGKQDGSTWGFILKSDFLSKSGVHSLYVWRKKKNLLQGFQKPLPSWLCSSNCFKSWCPRQYHPKATEIPLE